MDDSKIFVDLIENVGKKYSSELEEIKNKSQTIQQSMMKLKEKFFKHLGINCKNELEYLVQNTGKSESPEFKNKVKEYEKCFAENDMGLIDFVEEMSNSYTKLSSKFDNCFENCRSYPQENIKLCVDNCFVESIREFKNLFETIENKFSQLEDYL